MTNLSLRAQHFGSNQELKLWVGSSGLFVINMWLLVHGQFNLACALNLAAILISLFFLNTEVGICVTFLFLFLLGDIRRLVSEAISFTKLDLLLLVGPAFGIVIGLPLLIHVRVSDRISQLVLALMFVMTLEIFNPKQGGITVGLAGALFYLIPTLFFWIGRRYGTNEMLRRLLYRVILPISLLAAVLGFYQTYVGFLPWEQAWIDSLGGSLHSLFLASGVVRAFGFSASGVEYMGLLLVGCTIAIAGIVSGKKALSLALPFLFVALFLASSRTSIVKVIVAMAMIWSLRKGRGKAWLFRFAIGLTVCATILTFGLSGLDGGDSGGLQSAAQLSINHQAGGLTHPLDDKQSTAGVHGKMLIIGLSRGFTSPLGMGLGAATLGSGKFDGAQDAAGSSEVDISDVYSSLGIVGGLIYTFLAFLIMRAALDYSQTAPKDVGLAALGILVATAGGWLALGQYGMTPLVWFVIGILSRTHTDPSLTRRSAIPGQLSVATAS